MSDGNDGNDRSPTCRSCGERPATGIIFQLCSPCFEEFERRIFATTGSYRPTDEELEYINDPFIKRPN